MEQKGLHGAKLRQYAGLKYRKRYNIVVFFVRNRLAAGSHWGWLVLAAGVETMTAEGSIPSTQLTPYIGHYDLHIVYGW